MKTPSSLLMAFLFASEHLEMELDRSLHDARGRRAHHLSKSGIADVAVHGNRPKKLGVIEDIEGVEPEIQRF
jgi:hypothetical protein